jgi:flagellar biosynthesis protein FlhF
MKLYTFQGENPAIALQKAQSVCGKDALVVSTKQLQKKTLTSPALYEVVVATEEKRQAQQEREKMPKKKVTFDDEVILDISSRAKELSVQVKEEQKSTQPQTVTAISNEEFERLQKDLKSLNDKLNNLQEVLWEDKAEKRANLIIPPEFASIYNVAKKSGMAQTHLDAIMKSTLEHMPPYMKNAPETIERYFQVLLKKMIGVRVEREIPKGSKKIMMLVGPTGVGKTTTLAKLAARFSFIEHNYKVGIITLDTYRIGALEQLFQYAKMMKLPIEDVVDTFDFQKALDTLSYCDLILIDTVGSSQFDREKLEKISQFLHASDRSIDVNLVVSASTKLEDLRDIYENFAFLNLDTLIVTKFDETKGFGNIFSLVTEASLPLSYFSVGQEVPDDIMPASSDFLVECIFNGYKGKER